VVLVSGVELTHDGKDLDIIKKVKGYIHAEPFHVSITHVVKLKIWYGFGGETIASRIVVVSRGIQVKSRASFCDV